VRVPGEVRDEGARNVTSLKGIRHARHGSPRSVRCLYGYGEQAANGGLRRPGIPRQGARPGVVSRISLEEGRRYSRPWLSRHAPSPGAFAVGSAMRPFLRTHRGRRPGGVTDPPAGAPDPRTSPRKPRVPGVSEAATACPGRLRDARDGPSPAAGAPSRAIRPPPPAHPSTPPHPPITRTHAAGGPHPDGHEPHRATSASRLRARRSSGPRRGPRSGQGAGAPSRPPRG